MTVLFVQLAQSELLQFSTHLCTLFLKQNIMTVYTLLMCDMSRMGRSYIVCCDSLLGPHILEVSSFQHPTEICPEWNFVHCKLLLSRNLSFQLWHWSNAKHEISMCLQLCNINSVAADETVTNQLKVAITYYKLTNLCLMHNIHLK